METISISKTNSTPTQCPTTPVAPAGVEDANLVALCLEGNQSAWNHFVTVYGSIINHAVTWTLSHHGAAKDAADDIVQDIFFRLIKSEYRLLESWDSSRGTLKTWLAVVSRSAAIDFIRTDRTYMYDAIEDYENILTENTNILDLPDLPLHALSTRQKSVLQCLYGEEMTAIEAGQHLDIHPQTVRSIHHTALSKLRSVMFN